MKRMIFANKYWLVFLFLIVLLKSIFSSRLGFSLIDEGEYLHNALRILRGDLPYRDFFSYQPPLYNYWNILAFKLFGVSVFSARLLNSIIFSTASVLFFLIARRFSSRPVAFLVSLAFSFMETGMERLFYHVFTFSGLLLFFTFRKEGSFKLLFSGIFLGLAVLFRIDVGVLFFLGLLIGSVVEGFKLEKTFFLKKVKKLTIFTAGFMSPLFMFAFWLLANDIVSEFINGQLRTPLQITNSYSLPIPAVWEILPTSMDPRSLFHSYETFVLYSFFLVYIFFSVYLFKSYKKIWKSAPGLIYLYIIAILTIPYALGRTDLGHIVKGCIPAFFLGAYLMEKAKCCKKIMLLVTISFIAVGLTQIVWLNNFYSVSVKTNNGIIRLSRDWPEGSVNVSAGTVRKAISFINSNSTSEDQVFLAPYMAGLYFLTDRPSKSYAGNIFHTYLPEEEKFIKEISKLDIKAVIYDPVNGPENSAGLKRLKSYYPKLDQYIFDNFDIKYESPEGWLFLIKK